MKRHCPVPCVCPLCNGNTVSRHVRRKHLAFLKTCSSSQPTCAEPHNIYSDVAVKQPLPHCTKEHQLQCCMLLSSIFTGFWEALSSMLAMEHSVLPTGNKLPASYSAALQAIEPYLVEPRVYDVCENDCIIFRNENAHLIECPKCLTPRFISQQSHIARRRFTYLPLKPRLTRFFGTANLAGVLQSHATTSHNDSIFDIQQSEAWKEAYSTSGVFKGDPRGLSLALCTDGVNPFAHNRVTYSMWPVMLTLLNLPRNMRNRFASILLVGIIPANGTKEPHNLNPYLDILVDELLDMCNSTLFDAYSNAPFQCKVEVLLYVLDYPGIGKVMSVVGSGGYQGCAYCDIEGEWNPNLQKIIYLQNRRYLPASSELRKDTNSFPSKYAEERQPPKKKSYQDMIAYHKAYDNAEERSHAQAQQIAKATGCKSSYSLMRLPFHNRVTQSVPDAMHTIADCVEKLHYLIIGKSNVRAKGKIVSAERSLGRFGLKPTTTHQNADDVPWQLSSGDIKLASKRLRDISIPSHLDFKPLFLFTHPTRLKSHDWKQVACTGILKYCLRGMLETLFLFLDTLTSLLSESHQCGPLSDLKDQVDHVLALLERDFPMSINDITTHLLHHIVDGLERFGPVYSTWMYAFERFNSWLCRRALNRFRPESTIMETYRIFEWCEFMMLSDLVPSGEEVSRQSSTSKPQCLDDTEVQMMKPLVRECSLPFQTPMEVNVHRHLIREEIDTGRKIEFSSGVVLLHTSPQQYAKIDYLFRYKSVSFACCQIFDSVIARDFMHYVADATLVKKTILPLEKLSRPLVFAEADNNDIWILSV